ILLWYGNRSGVAHISDPLRVGVKAPRIRPFHTSSRQQVFIRIIAAIYKEVDKFVSVQQIDFFGELTKAGQYFVVDITLPFFTSFGGNQDYSTRRSRTINSCRSSIFQYIDGFDIIWVNI